MKIIFPVYDDYDDGFDENQITSRMLCASNPGKDSCQGDSGGDCDDSNDEIIMMTMIMKVIKILIETYQ